MKRITAIAIAVSALVGCSYVGGAGAADSEYTASTTCREVWELSPQPKTEKFIAAKEMNHAITDDVEKTSISMCISAMHVAMSGGSINDVLSTINKSSASLPEDGRLQMAFMAVSGWKIGELNRR